MRQTIGTLFAPGDIHSGHIAKSMKRKLSLLLCEQTAAVSLLVGYGNKFKLASWLVGGVMSEWALQDAKNHFSAVVNAALAGKPQTVTRRGTPAVVVVAVEDYRRLCQVEKDSAPTFVEHLLAFPQGGEEFERMPLEVRPLDI